MSAFGLIEALFDYRADLILWMLASIGIYGLGVNLWHSLSSRRSGRLPQLLNSFASRPHGFLCFQALRFCYYLCIPYVALTRGVTNATLMGMWSEDWFEAGWFAGVPLGAALGIGTLALLLWGWRGYVRATKAIRYSTQQKPFLPGIATVMTPWGWGLILLEVLYLEMHWAFYRSATIRLMGNYYGVFLGLLVIFAEWWLNPDIRRHRTVAHQSGETLTTAALALSVSVIYYFTSNLWLCVAVHLAVQCMLLLFLAVWYRSPNYEGQND